MYTKETFVIYVVEHKQECLEKYLVEELAKIADSREWTIEAPNVIVTEDEAYGIKVTVYSAIGTGLPKDIDRKCYEDVKIILELCCGIGKTSKMDFEVDYRDECIGEIVKGKMDKSLTVGLLGEWKKALGD